MPSTTTLLERARELAAVQAAIAATAAGRGGVAAIVGEAGIGKTALLDSARASCEEQGLRVLSARGGELERELSFGAARQLLEPVADPAVTLDPVGLVEDLAASGPLMLAVDDAQWVDAASLRFLGHLARRSEGLSVLILAATRLGEPGTDRELLERELLDLATTIRPAPLTRAATAELVRETVAGAADDRFADACHEATGGNPFLVTELLAGARAHGLAGDASDVPWIDDMGSRSVARGIVERIARAGPVAVAVADAVALLGRDAEPDRIASLTGNDDAAVADSLAALRGAGILTADGPGPPGFRHSMIRAAVYDSILPATRSRRHRQAAALLQAAGAEPERVAGHLMATAPMADLETVESLRTAAASALGSGAPDTAARYLQRALAEPPPRALCAEVALELGDARFGFAPAEAVEPLRMALDAAGSGPLRARTTLMLAKALNHAGRPREGVEVLEAATGTALDDELEAELLVWALWWADNDRRAEHLARLDRAAARVAAGGDALGSAGAARKIRILRAWTIVGGEPGTAAEALDLTERALGAGISFDDYETGTIAAMTVICLDAVETADRLLADGIDELRQAGQLAKTPFLYAHHAHALSRAGRLDRAESQARAGWALAADQGPETAVWWYSICGLLQALIARGAGAEAIDLIESQGLGQDVPDVVVVPLPRELRGRARLLAGDLEAGVADLLDCGRWFEERGWRNPARSEWSTAVTPALAALGRTSEAGELAERTLERARRFGAAGTLGRALRSAGLALGGTRGRELMVEAVEVFEPLPLRAELAHAQVELGAALRRANQRVAAREQLEAGRELAGRCGARALAARAARELATTGVRTRRVALGGVGALTESERRAAELAADGLTNREVAQLLFVTTKTVERHLTHVYQKLEIASRDELAVALADGVHDVPSR
jgi:DNA-binding CsgD family transcriptional regulator